MNAMDAKDHVASEDVRKWKIEGRIVDDDMIDFLVRVGEGRAGQFVETRTGLFVEPRKGGLQQAHGAAGRLVGPTHGEGLVAGLALHPCCHLVAPVGGSLVGGVASVLLALQGQLATVKETAIAHIAAYEVVDAGV